VAGVYRPTGGLDRQKSIGVATSTYALTKATPTTSVKDWLQSKRTESTTTINAPATPVPK